MSGNDPKAACDRLIRIVERAQSLGVGKGPESDDTIKAPIVPLAMALLRMRVRPALGAGWLETDPVQVALVGGTNTGKSTVLNVLLGRDVAGMGVRARFSQHPEAYRPSSLGDRWLDGCESRFRGYRRYRNQHPPRQTDEEMKTQGYAPAIAVIDPLLSSSPVLAPLLSEVAVIWDGPDFSTEVAENYMSSVVDLIGLADLVVMTVTDEAYADDRGNAFLRMLANAGVSVVVVANKVPTNTTLLTDMSRTIESVGKTHTPLLHLCEVRGANPSERLERLLGTAEASSLRSAISRQIEQGRDLKRRALRSSIQYVGRNLDTVLDPLIKEAGVVKEWARIVDEVTRERVLDPYQRDYLEGIHYGEFNRTLVHLVQLLRFPVVGPIVETAGLLVRLPVRLVRKGIQKYLNRPGSGPKVVPEEEVLSSAAQSWFLRLLSEAQAKVGTEKEAAWVQIAEKMNRPQYRDSVQQRFQRGFQEYRDQFEDEVRRRAEALYLKLKEDPRRLHALRGANLLAGTASVAFAVKTAGLGWSDAVIGPVVAGVWHNLLEWGLGRYVDTLRSDLMAHQLAAVESLVERSLAEPLKTLLDTSVSEGDLAQAAEDFELVKAEALRVAGGSDA